MQVENYDNLLERLQYYAFHVFNSMATKGKKGFAKMSPIHCICIIEGKISLGEAYQKRISLKGEDNNIIMGGLTFHLIELGKFPIKKADFEQIDNEKDEIFYTMKYAHTISPDKKSEVPTFWEKPTFKVALEKLDTSKMSPLQRAMLEMQIARENVVKYKRNQEAKARREERKQYKAEIAAREVEIAAREMEIAAREMEIAAREAEKATMEAEIASRETEKVTMKAEITAKEAEIATIKNTSIISAIQLNMLTDEQIAMINSVEVSLVQQIRQQL